MLTPWQGQGIRHPRYPAAPDAASPGTPGKQKEGCTNANDHPGAAVLEEGLQNTGTGGRTRTDKRLPPGDFESPASTNFATPATREALYVGPAAGQSGS